MAEFLQWGISYASVRFDDNILFSLFTSEFASSGVNVGSDS